MTNAARRLHEQFTQWQNEGDGTSSAAARGMGDTVAASTAHLHVMADLLEVEAKLRQMDTAGRPVDTFQKMLPSWTMTVLSYPNWQNGPQINLYTAHSMDVLKLLADTLDAFTPTLDLGSLDDIVGEAWDLLREDTTITPELRGYIYGLLQELRLVAATGNVPDSFDINASVERLWVSFHAAAEQSQAPARWRDMAKDLFVATAGGLLANLPSIAMQASQMPALLR